MSELSDGKEEVLSKTSLADGRKLTYSGCIAAAHPSNQYNDVELIYYVTDKEGTTERFVDAFPWRYYFRYEVEHLLARCGFRIIDQYGDFDLSPLDDSSAEMIFVTEKLQFGRSSPLEA